MAAGAQRRYAGGMTEKPGTREERERRQAEALKANLRRRKAQARAQADGGADKAATQDGETPS